MSSVVHPLFKATIFGHGCSIALDQWLHRKLSRAARNLRATSFRAELTKRRYIVLLPVVAPPRSCVATAFWGVAAGYDDAFFSYIYILLACAKKAHIIYIYWREDLLGLCVYTVYIGFSAESREGEYYRRRRRAPLAMIDADESRRFCSFEFALYVRLGRLDRYSIWKNGACIVRGYVWF